MKKYIVLFIFMWAFPYLHAEPDTIQIKLICDFDAERFEKVKYLGVNQTDTENNIPGYDRISRAYDSTVIYKDYGYYQSYEIPGIESYQNCHERAYWYCIMMPHFIYEIAVPYGYEYLWYYIPNPYAWNREYLVYKADIKVIERKLIATDIRMPIGHVKRNCLPLKEYPNDTIVTEEVQYIHRYDPIRGERVVRRLGTGYTVHIIPFYYDAKKRELYLSKMEVSLYFHNRYHLTWDPSNPDVVEEWKWTVEHQQNHIYNFEDFLRWYPVSIDGVPSINNDKESKEGRIYDLLGREITHPVKGNIYIKNGRKILW